MFAQDTIVLLLGIYGVSAMWYIKDDTVFLVCFLAAIVACIVFIIEALGTLRARRRKLSSAVWQRGVIAVIAFAVSAWLAASCFEERFYIFNRAMKISAVSFAINNYWQEHGDTPESLASLKACGCSADELRIPISGWNLSGPPLIYEPVKGRSEAGFIVVVEPRTPRTPAYRGYIVLGTWPVQSATDEEIRQLLALDDAKRERAGQPDRWGKIGDGKSGTEH